MNTKKMYKTHTHRHRSIFIQNNLQKMRRQYRGPRNLLPWFIRGYILAVFCLSGANYPLAVLSQGLEYLEIRLLHRNEIILRSHSVVDYFLKFIHRSGVRLTQVQHRLENDSLPVQGRVSIHHRRRICTDVLPLVNR